MGRALANAPPILINLRSQPIMVELQACRQCNKTNRDSLDGAAPWRQASEAPRSDGGEQVERVPSDRASEDTYEMSDDDYREDRRPSTSRTREYAI